MTRTISAPPPGDEAQGRRQELLFDLGPRRLVLVEGVDDAAVYSELFQEALGAVMFHDCGGGQAAEQEFAVLSELSTQKQVYVILDRDFRDAAEVDAWRADGGGRRFVLRYYAVENYLLHPEAVWGALRGLKGAAFPVSDAAQMNEKLRALCHDLAPVMAVNWLLLEDCSAGRGHLGERYFARGDERIGDRDAILRAAAKKLECSVEECEQRVRGKEERLSPALRELSSAYEFINGKHLLFRVWKLFLGRGVEDTYLRNLLVQRTRERSLVASDLRDILQRILTPGVGPGSQQPHGPLTQQRL